MKAPTSIEATTPYIHALVDNDDWDCLLETLEFLDSTDTGYGVSHLVKTFGETSLVLNIGRACRAKGCPSFVIDALELALQGVEKLGDKSTLVIKLLEFGDFYHDFYDNNDRAVRWWEEAIARMTDAGPAVQREYADEKVTYTNKLAQLYFDEAVHNFEGESFQY